MAVIAIGKLREYYYSLIDIKELSSVDDVNRLIDMIELHRGLCKEAKDKGMLMETKNGSQEFTKINPAVDAINKTGKAISDAKKEIAWQSSDEAPPEDNIDELV